MPNEEFLLTTENVDDYLTGCGLVRGDEEIVVRELGGGVSNVVLLVEWPGTPLRRWVVKQSLGKLRVKDDWRSERERIFREAEALQTLRPVLGPAALPEVIHLDKEKFLLVMTAAPRGSLSWKDLLLGRRGDAGVAREAALLLAKIINASRGDPLPWRPENAAARGCLVAVGHCVCRFANRQTLGHRRNPDCL